MRAKEFALGIVFGMMFSGVVTFAYVWDFDHSMPDNLNRQQEQSIQEQQRNNQMNGQLYGAPPNQEKPCP